MRKRYLQDQSYEDVKVWINEQKHGEKLQKKRGAKSIVEGIIRGGLVPQERGAE